MHINSSLTSRVGGYPFRSFARGQPNLLQFNGVTQKWGEMQSWWLHYPQGWKTQKSYHVKHTGLEKRSPLYCKTLETPLINLARQYSGIKKYLICTEFG